MRILSGYNIRRISLYVRAFDFAHMPVMSHKSDFFLPCSSEVNISELAFYFTIVELLTATQTESPSYQIPTGMLYLYSLNSYWGEVMRSSTNEISIICDLSKLTLEIKLNTWLASMNVDSKSYIA